MGLNVMNRFVADKVKGWAEEVIEPSRFAESQPHAAYCAFMHGLSSRWLFVSRTVPSDSAVFQPLEDMICQVFIPALTGCSPHSDSVRQLFALPARWGGLGVFVPISGCASELSASCSITEPLCQCIRDHTSSIVDAFSAQLTRRNAVHRARSQGYSDCFSDLHQQLEPSLQRAMDLAAVRGASSWLTTVPLNEHGFALHKSAFQALRYGWPPLCSPSLCACGVPFSVGHVLSCPKGGLPSFRYNEVRDLTANLLTEVCS